MKTVWWSGLAALALARWLAAADSCFECHRALEGKLKTPAESFSEDVHRKAGFGCHDCHGGDPGSDDPWISMSRAKGFLGKISRKTTPALCARCHSNATLMHNYKPRQRVDQLAQYQTSVHGKRLAAGDEAVANCVDCHGVHQLREVNHALSPVHPLRLPQTCGRCHSDAKRMASYKVSTTQLDDYKRSVHWDSLSKRRDLSAPSCASCHGNHGATPPNVTAVAAVCGSCHALQQELYQSSPHQPVFAGMGAGGCVVCHGNHEIVSPTDAMLHGTASVCGQCHDSASAGGKLAESMFSGIQNLESSIARSEAILNRARRSGMEVSDAVLRLQDAKESLIKARVAVHAFSDEKIIALFKEGPAIAGETYSAGESILRERDFRRYGLAASLAAILLTIAGLWLVIRKIEVTQSTHVDRS
jgi:hypothetical protein